MRRMWWPLLVVPWASGCSPEREAPSTFTVADSAGIEVIATKTPVWDAGGAWTIAGEPSLRIGLLEGEAPYLFSDIASVLELSNGTIVVGDGGSRQVRFFDANGVFARSVGRAGDGPGEYPDLAWVARCGRGLLVLSRRNRRLTSLSLSGELLGTRTLSEPEADRVPYRTRCGPKGGLAFVGWGAQPAMRPDVTFDYYAQTAPLWWLRQPDADPMPIGEYVSSERVLTYDPQRRTGGSGPHPFSRSVVFAVDESLYVGSSERLQIEQRDRDGNLARLMRGPDDDLSIDEAFIRRYRDVPLTGIDSIMRDRLEREDWPMPPRVPAYSELLLDPEGCVWVERFRLPWQAASRWGVFSRSGAFLGHVELPEGFHLMSVTSNHLLGVSRDELDVERVEVYALDRGEG